MTDGPVTARLWPQDLAGEQTFTNPTHESFGDDELHVEEEVDLRPPPAAPIGPHWRSSGHDDV